MLKTAGDVQEAIMERRTGGVQEHSWFGGTWEAQTGPINFGSLGVGTGLTLGFDLTQGLQTLTGIAEDRHA